MSSSVFIESPPSTPGPECSLLSGLGGGGAITGSDGNLVIVYGKNGLNVDRQGLQNLIDEKGLSSISVVRITSPTPSMEDEESDTEDAKKKANSESEKDDSEDDGSNEDDELLATLRGKVRKPEVVGLTVEEFYSVEEANKLAKEILNCAGVVKPPVGYDLEFHRYVIRNDHCYTPYTSEEDMKKKLEVEKQEIEKKIIQSPPMKQYSNKNLKKSLVDSIADNAPTQKIDKVVGEEVEGEEEEEEYDESEYSESESSAETDNDRDSDLDFDLNNRNGKKRKKLKKPKKLSRTEKKALSIQDTHTEVNKKQQNIVARLNRSSSDCKKPLAATISTPNPKVPAVIAPLSIPKPVVKPSETEIATRKIIKLVPSISAPVLAQPVVPTHVHVTPTKQPPVTPTKGGGFTDISSLITRPDSTNVNVKVVELKPAQSVHVAPPIRQSKGFMPIAIDSASASQLPAQISIQTHQSSSELAAENDKQLDLIDSIVKDQMQNSTIIENTMNENIPELVKMLESTEQAVLDKSINNNPNANASSTSLRFSNTVEDIDIANAPLLDSAEDDLTEDFLQDVVELMKERAFREVVEKQVFSSNTTEIDIPPCHLINPEPKPIIYTPQIQRKSLIETSVSNVSQFESDLISSMAKTPTIRKDPIQIIRGNGRVITLPPIEAPTTRAKRRALVTPIGNSSPLSITSSENLEISGSTEIGQIITLPTRTSICETEFTVVTPVRARASTDVKATSTGKKRAGGGGKRKMKEVEEKELLEAGSQEEDEDDPNKLWCICRQPHNNRFMICCDECQGWFHGTCVNITKAMGLDMEKKGIEYRCPNCVKEIENRKKQKEHLFELRAQEIPVAAPVIVTDIQIIPATLPTPIVVQAPPPKPLKKQYIEITSVQTIPANSIIMKSVDMRPPQFAEVSQVQVIKTPETTSKPVKKMVKLNRSLQIIKKRTPTTPKPPTTLVNPTSSSSPKPQLVSKLVTKVPAPEKADADAGYFCIVCKKKTKVDSIYCSDECIRKHAVNSLNVHHKVGKLTIPDGPNSPSIVGTPDDKKKKQKGRFEDLLLMADAKPKAERVYVYERKSGRILTGSSAPTTINLKKWLQDNPTFEVVQPGSPQALEIEKIRQRGRGNTIINVVTTDAITATPTKVQTVTLSSNSTPVSQQSITKFIKVIPALNNQPRTSTPKVLVKYPQQVSLKPDKHEKPSTSESKPPEKLAKKQISSDRSSSGSHDSEPIRVSIRRTFKEQLIARMNEIKDDVAPKLTIKETENFAHQTEIEMYNLFNKDTGTKYKAKYRSLMFNIKDRKNETLFQKICEKEIEPKQLVRMSPEELASQELALWRQNENKHQLEMIKKSELDLLSCAKNYVLKTHKGEEVIESKEMDRVNLDLTIPVEDVVTVLNNSAVSSTSDANSTAPKPISFETSYELDSTYFGKSLDITAEKKKTKEKDREKRHKSKDRHKEKSRKRSRSRSRERRHKSPHRDDRKDKEKRERVDKESKPKSSQPTAKKLAITKPAVDHVKVETFSLIDQILESTKTVEEAANLVKDKKAPAVTINRSLSSVTTNEPHPVTLRTISDLPLPKADINSSVDSDQEPSSTVVIATPPENPYQKYRVDLSTVMWQGIIDMIDVATFQIMIQPFAGISAKLEKDFSYELNIVGRIHKNTVWDYLSKVKMSPNKEIVILRLIPASDAEDIGYSELFTYLHQRSRLGVVKASTPNIKDFYVMPLAGDDDMPNVLAPLCNLDDSDELRPDILFAVIVRIMPMESSSGSKSVNRMKESVISKRKATVLGEDGNSQHYTPPGSPKRKSQLRRLPSMISDDIDLDAIIKAPITSKKAIQPSSTLTTTKPLVDDEDEPYSPGGSFDSGDESSTPAFNVSARGRSPQNELDEINRQIAVRAKDLVDMYNKRPPGSLPPPPAAIVPSLANISLPANLSQILANINKIPDRNVPAQTFVQPNMDEEYVPEPIASSYKPSGSKTGSRLGQLSEAELLSLVPPEAECNILPRKRARWDDPPPPPGVDEDDDFL